MSEKQSFIELKDQKELIDQEDSRKENIDRPIEVKTEADITYSEAVYNILISSFPSILTCVVYRTVTILNFIVIGRLEDPAYVSGAGLGIVTYTIV